MKEWIILKPVIEQVLSVQNKVRKKFYPKEYPSYSIFFKNVDFFRLALCFCTSC